jgi:4-hydroxy-tetrahydrodipicolinate synthase
VPIILYTVPSRTGVNIPLSVYDKLSNNEKIVAVKEASASVSDMAKLCAKCSDRLDVYSGNDDLILPTLSLGGMGVISVLSNILPKEVGEICRLWFNGKTTEVRALQLRLLPLINSLFSEVNPIPIKALLSKESFCAEEYRLPLCSMTEDKKKALFKTWAEFKGIST